MSEDYDFSQVYHAACLAYSPGSTFIATAHLDRVIVRSTSTLAIVRTWQCRAQVAAAGPSKQAETTIDGLEWASDGLYILAYSIKTAMAWVFGLANEGSGESGEMARIGGSGVEGLIHAEWSKAGKDVLAWSDHGLRLTIYSLSHGNASVIQNPKGPNCRSYSPDSRYLAVVERYAGKEHVGIYDCMDQYKLVRHFPIKTSYAHGISWSPDGKWLAVWDSPLSYSLYIHSPIGSILMHFSPDSPNFSSGSNEDPGLGIRTVTWAPGGRYLAIGGWDGRVRVLELEGFRCMANLGWGGRIAEKGATIWREPHEWLKDTRGRGVVQFSPAPSHSPLPTLRSDMTKYPPLAGVFNVSFNPSATHFFVQLDTQPCVLHIHTFLPTSHASSPTISQCAALVFTNPIKHASWSPGGARVTIATRSGAVYFWDMEGWINEEDSMMVAAEEAGGMAEGVGIPSRVDFSAQSVHWSPDGGSLAIQDRSQFCLLYDESAALKAEAQAVDADQSMLERTTFHEGLSHVSEGEEEEESMVWRRPVGSWIAGAA